MRIRCSGRGIGQLRRRRKVWLFEVLPQEICFVNAEDLLRRQRPTIDTHFIDPTLKVRATLVTCPVRTDSYGHGCWIINQCSRLRLRCDLGPVDIKALEFTVEADRQVTPFL